MRVGVGTQTAAGYAEAGGFDVSFQAEALVYPVRYHDHAATAEIRREIESPARSALAWLASRVASNGVVQTASRVARVWLSVSSLGRQ